MTPAEFSTSITGAEAFRALAESPADADYWRGYIQGIRRHYHGDAFGTAEDHATWSGQAGSSDHGRRMLGMGYAAGCAGLTVYAAARELFLRMARVDFARSGGSAKTEKKTASCRANGLRPTKPGSRPRGRPKTKGV